MFRGDKNYRKLEEKEGDKEALLWEYLENEKKQKEKKEKEVREFKKIAEEKAKETKKERNNYFDKK